MRRTPTHTEIKRLGGFMETDRVVVEQELGTHTTEGGVVTRAPKAAALQALEVILGALRRSQRTPNVVSIHQSTIG